MLEPGGKKEVVGSDGAKNPTCQTLGSLIVQGGSNWEFFLGCKEKSLRDLDCWISLARKGRRWEVAKKGEEKVMEEEIKLIIK
ncbi:translation initiation factor eIF-2B subunit delta-like [Pyrus ussuriensis x Pyrus communis]|uniref:Translation initiation factor eIF-2B subunit delta-like n=1 Tax=Pyrus ussuriensis x Pyrus communis TaxID=2448454 RepID=A0A5N5HQI2_9ROSA|nr:translation initiation factor eIF-2B subunit delta-like [Pyrus ussuriensis x Pyrus communis]